MIGKIMNVTEFELKFGNKQRKINVYACFKEKKFNTTIILFNFINDNKLLYGNAHVKKDKIVIMKLNQDKSDLVLNFINDLLLNKLNDYEIINLNELENVEIISYNNIEFELDKLKELEMKTIEKPKNEEKEEKISNHKLIVFVFILLFLTTIFSYIFINKEKIFNKELKYECIKTYKHNEIEVDVKEIRTINFVKNRLNRLDIEVNYKFFDKSNYLIFKRNEKHYNYSLYKDGTYKYVDDSNTLKMYYNNYKDKEMKEEKRKKVLEYYENLEFKCNLIEEA